MKLFQVNQRVKRNKLSVKVTIDKINYPPIKAKVFIDVNMDKHFQCQANFEVVDEIKPVPIYSTCFETTSDIDTKEKELKFIKKAIDVTIAELQAQIYHLQHKKVKLEKFYEEASLIEKSNCTTNE